MKNLHELSKTVFFVTAVVLITLGLRAVLGSPEIGTKVLVWVFFGAMIVSGFAIELTRRG